MPHITLKALLPILFSLTFAFPAEDEVEDDDDFDGISPSPGLLVLPGQVLGPFGFSASLMTGPVTVMFDDNVLIEAVSRNGVTAGFCSYVDEEGRTVTINYVRHPNGTVTANSQQEFVKDPVAALNPCKESARRQEEKFREQMEELQENLHMNQEKLQENLAHMQENIQQNLQKMQENLKSVFCSGKFPFNYINC